MIDASQEGVIFSEHTIHVICGLCSFSMNTQDSYANDTQQSFAIEIRSIGWMKTKKHGWICDSCSPEYRETYRRSGKQ